MKFSVIFYTHQINNYRNILKINLKNIIMAILFDTYVKMFSVNTDNKRKTN
jgi:hypothetical protein